MNRCLVCALVAVSLFLTAPSAEMVGQENSLREETRFVSVPIVTRPKRITQDEGDFAPTPPTKSARHNPKTSGKIKQSSTENLPRKRSQDSSDTTSRRTTALLDTCFVKLIEDIEIPAEESGKITAIHVKPGDDVGLEQPIAQMDDQRAQRMLEEASLKFQSADRLANDETEIRSAYKKMILAQREHEDIATLARKGSESKQAYQRSKYAMQISELDYQAAKNKKSLAALDKDAESVRVNAAKDSIKRNALKSPVEGIVFEVFKDKGEWVTAGDKIMRVARMDRVRIQGFVEAKKYDPSEIANRPVTVTLQLARDQEQTFSGEIVFVSYERGGNRYKVWAEVDNVKKNNRWILQAESEVTMEIHLDRESTSVTKRSSGNSVPR